MNLSDDEIEMLRELAELDGLDASSYLRTLIRQQHAERIGSKPTKKKR